MINDTLKNLGATSSSFKSEVSSVRTNGDVRMFEFRARLTDYHARMQKTAKEITQSVAFLHLTSGAIAGAFSRTATAPLDRMKLVMQLSYSSRRLSLMNTIKSIYKEEGSLHSGILGLGSRGGIGGGGLISFFRGNGTNCVKIAPETAIKFFSYDLFKRKILGSNENESRGLEDKESLHHKSWFISFVEKVGCGGCAGATAQLIIYPMEVVKTRLATCPPNYYSGIFNCIVSTYRLEGARALYRGLTPSLFGIFPYAGIDLACFETFKKAFSSYRKVDNSHSSSAPPAHLILLCGAMSSSLGQVVAYPIALIRTRMQADGMGGNPRRYTSLIKAFSITYREEGFFGFYKGVGPNLLKAVPAVSISWVVYENCKRWFSSVVQ